MSKNCLHEISAQYIDKVTCRAGSSNFVVAFPLSPNAVPPVDPQILEELIKHRWGAIDDQQREGIKNYLSNLIIKISSDEVTLRREKVFLNKLNILLVQVRTDTIPISHDTASACALLMPLATISQPAPYKPVVQFPACKFWGHAIVGLLIFSSCKMWVNQCCICLSGSSSRDGV